MFYKEGCFSATKKKLSLPKFHFLQAKTKRRDAERGVVATK